LAALTGVVFYVDTSRRFIREGSCAQSVCSKHAAVRWGVVQPVGHLTVNAHEAIAQEAAGLGNKTQSPVFTQFPIIPFPRTQEHQSARFIKTN